MSGSLREPRIRAIVEDLGFIVVTTDLALTYRVRTAEGAPVATYDVHQDLAFRFATTDAWAGNARQDCLDWNDFHSRLLRRAPVEA